MAGCQLGSGWSGKLRCFDLDLIFSDRSLFVKVASDNLLDGTAYQMWVTGMVGGDQLRVSTYLGFQLVPINGFVIS